MIIITILVIGLALYIYFDSKKSTIPKAGKSAQNDLKIDFNSKNNKESASIGNQASRMQFQSKDIIDVSGLNLNLTINGSEVKKYVVGVPYWKHHYVYSHSELEYASFEQKEFYYKFKNAFVAGEYYDLEGNNNYSFILLFDLLNQYNSHEDIRMLEHQLTALGSNYPKAKSYALSFLSEKMLLIGDYEGAERISNKRFSTPAVDSDNYYDYDYWRLGNKFKTVLSLNDADVELLNCIWFSSNNFSNIEFCCKEIVRLFVGVIKGFQQTCKNDGTSFEAELQVIGDLIARKHFRYRLNSSNYKYTLTSSATEIYTYIFKVCENSLREFYGHKRKITAEFQYTHKEILVEFTVRVASRVNTIVEQVISTVELPDIETEIKLNTQNTSRWKTKFEQLKSAYQEGQGKQFLNDIVKLGELNKLNPSVENIFYEASKFISKSDKEVALCMYVYYIYYDLNSASFDNKQLAKTIEKSLFPTPEQLGQFESLINEFIADRDLGKALQGIASTYAAKRKKIKLDSEGISQVRERHAVTVNLLNEYLKEEEEVAIVSQAVPPMPEREEISLKINQPSGLSYANPIGEVEFHESQFELLQLFKKHSYVVLQEDVNSFARSKGMFRNQLIESINDSCYELLDDLLIEEEDENYIINEAYYQKIFRND